MRRSQLLWLSRMRSRQHEIDCYDLIFSYSRSENYAPAGEILPDRWTVSMKEVSLIAVEMTSLFEFEAVMNLPALARSGS